eukprot:COSAG02_NODE_90_length_37755_cov_29.833364_40_plen_76_part_00
MQVESCVHIPEWWHCPRAACGASASRPITAQNVLRRIEVQSRLAAVAIAAVARFCCSGAERPGGSAGTGLWGSVY